MTLISETFSQAELQQLTQRSDFLAWVTVISHWAIVVAAFALVAWQANVLTVLLALVLLGGRQLGCGALMHECGHGSLFASKKLNQFVGKWFAAAPMLFRIDDYMASHLKHHRNIGNSDDPDLYRYQRYPTDAVTFRRKLWRDLTGRTSWKNLLLALRDNQIVQIDSNGRKRFSFRQLLVRWHAPLLTNALMFALLAITGYPWLYLLWVVSYFSTFMVFSRIRNLAEHAAVPDLTSEDPLQNTRTTIPRWWERFMFAPNSVCYHLEHHLVPSVPKYRLADFHKTLRAKGLLDDADICFGYLAVVRKLVAPAKSLA